MQDRPLLHLLVPHGWRRHLPDVRPPLPADVAARAGGPRPPGRVGRRGHRPQLRAVARRQRPTGGRGPHHGWATAAGRQARPGRLTVWTPNSPNAYRPADAYRAKGVPVVLGGVHASLLPGEALRHADAVVSGEADPIFGTVLADAAAGRLQPPLQGLASRAWTNVPMNHEWVDLVQDVAPHPVRPPEHAADHPRLPVQLRLLLGHPHQRPGLPPQPGRPGDRGGQGPQDGTASTWATSPTSSSSTTTWPPTSTTCGELSRGHPPLGRQVHVGLPGLDRPGPRPRAARPGRPGRACGPCSPASRACPATPSSSATRRTGPASTAS